MKQNKVSILRCRRAIKVVDQFLQGSLGPQVADHRRAHSCSRADFIRVAATFDHPFTQEEMAESLRQHRLIYEAKTPIDAIRTRLNKDPLFKTHKTNQSIPKAHFMLDRKIAKLVTSDIG